jgi:hypothetical protein
MFDWSGREGLEVECTVNASKKKLQNNKKEETNPRNLVCPPLDN